jgi:hypothetical protein
MMVYKRFEVHSATPKGFSKVGRSPSKISTYNIWDWSKRKFLKGEMTYAKAVLKCRKLNMKGR